MATSTTTSRKTPRVGNTTSGRKKTPKTVTIKKDVTKEETSTTNQKKSTTSKTAQTKTTKTMSTTKLTQKVNELEETISTLIKVLNTEFHTEMLQGPRGVSKALKKAGLVKDS